MEACNAFPALCCNHRTAVTGENKDQKMIQLAEHLDVAGTDVLKTAGNLYLESIVSKRL
jgi:hypothetical protein